MKQRITIYAEEGMVLTDGEHYGTIIHLADGEDSSKYHEISKAEYQKKMEEKNAPSLTHA